MPERLWTLANIYNVFGGPLHHCMGDGYRTVEFDGRVIGHGRKPFKVFQDAPSEEALDRLSRLDFGWIAVAGLLIATLVAGALEACDGAVAD
jgi:hypothetical protein